jgi:hypothetical protein
MGSFTPEQAAQEKYAEIGKSDYNTGGSIGVTTMLSSDCTGEISTGQYCGTIDTNFARAIEQKLTLSEAIAKGLIQGGSPFGYLPDGSEPSYHEGIPYRSILILRKYRVVPVGWELAAEYYTKFGIEENKDKNTGNLTLNKLIADYNKPDSPYFKLVDPNWLLKAPETICYKEGPGPDIVNTADYCEDPQDSNNDGDKQCQVIITRNTYCADERSCITEDANGNCKFYGYCVEEKPIWKIKGDECPAYFNACQTMTDQKDNKQVNYLTNTLEACTSPGCSAYCRNFNPKTNSWVCDESNLSFYTSDKTCSSSDEGCTVLTRVQNMDKTALNPSQITGITDLNNTGYLETPVKMRLAPTYAGTNTSCDGWLKTKNDKTNQSDCETSGFYWRRDINACVASGNPACSNFALQCKETDASCKLFTPVSIRVPAVPGVIENKICPNGCDNEADQSISWNDECPDSCVGFRTFTQSKTNFENGKNNVSFLNNTARVCSVSGCDEFTNLDKLAAGGETKEYYSFLRACVKPNNSDVKTFYTWEGSDTAGIQLKKWQLQAESSDAPKGTICVLGAAGVDCREIYNPENSQYYPRDFATVIFASDDCHPFRRTLVSSESECRAFGGSWQNNGCVYLAIPALSKACDSGNAGCRTYRDGSGYNSQNLINENFENGVAKWPPGILSNDSVHSGQNKIDHSLKIDNNVNYKLSLTDLVAGESYSVQILAKTQSGNSGSVTLALTSTSQPVPLLNKTLDLSGEWNLYKVDLGDLPAGTFTNPTLVISGNLFVDDVILKKINNLLVIKDSWETRAVCEQLTNGGMSSCEAYRDSAGQTVNLQKFSRLCLEDAVGCEAFIVNGASGQEWKYLVYDKNKECKESGCAKLGELKRGKIDPTKPEDFTFTSKYLVTGLSSTCQATEESCRQYSFNNNKSYAMYKSPGNRTCEYREYSGQYDWWITGEQTKCPRVSTTDNSALPKHCLGGRAIINPYNEAFSFTGDNSCESDLDCLSYNNFKRPGICTSWAGVCSSNNSGCEEYQDPLEPESCNLNLAPRVRGADGALVPCNFYYYANVETISGACTGDNADLTQHCFKKTGE